MQNIYLKQYVTQLNAYWFERFFMRITHVMCKPTSLRRLNVTKVTK